MAKAKLDKIAKMYTAASALSNNPKGKENSEEEMMETAGQEEADAKAKKRSKKLDFNEGRGGMRTTIYKDKE